MENLLRKVVGSIFVSAMLLSGVALVVVMLNYNKINPGAPTHAKAKEAVQKAEKAEEPKKAEEGISEEKPPQEAATVEEQETKPAE